MWIDNQVAQYKILGKTILLISEEICYGRNTIAEWESLPYYLGDVSKSIGSAIIAWQELNKQELTDEELRQTLIDNHLMSEAV